ncbi:sodium/proton antiporter NapA, CPA2 family [Jannaschia faecimaris]|uniref:Sodium/proton antiporter NapA, CPA2 family n=1 Tax=Jannaschia faecimaris TaxID=1244108 RepID=A0A1H3UBV6_9RHOB|nr:cation:proton antiporter [Jannaschia faecimaris]SDZ59953.1 sodium/proton antiporter NapA, CPA2 family [Jannaschia faecimaris]
MTEGGENYGTMMLMLGTVAVLSVPLRSALRRLSLPGMVAFIAFGSLISIVSSTTTLLPFELTRQVEILAQIGIVTLLFRVGMESDLDALVGQLRRATIIWIPNMAVPAALTFLLIWLWPGLGLVPAALTAIAASATSIGASTAAWEQVRAINKQDAALVLDVAELDDFTAVILLGVAFAILPQLDEGTSEGLVGHASRFIGLQGLKILAFCAVCYVFSRFAERRLSRIFANLDKNLGPFVFATGTVFLIAALADALGFSMAIGALFAGLAFSRDPEEKRIDEAFGYVLAIFGPFFFVSIGLSVEIEGVAASLLLALALFAVLVAGKLIGAGIPAALLAGRQTGLFLGTSMIPRAEIYLIVMLGGLHLGDWAVPQTLYNAAVLASVGTCLVGPIWVGKLLPALPSEEQGK